MCMSKKFYDTNAILSLLDDVFGGETFYISSVTLEELEHIKTSNNKDAEVKYQARRATHLLDEHDSEFEIVTYKYDMSENVALSGVEITNDIKICACASYIKNLGKDIVFVTDDIACKNFARTLFGLPVESSKNTFKEDNYTGFKEVTMTDEEMAEFYLKKDENKYDLLTNEYLIIKNQDGEIVDQLKWDGEIHKNLDVGNIKSKYFGKLKPYNGDVYQLCVMDSLEHNKITMIKGKAGTGKTYIAINYMFYLLEKEIVSRIVIFCNTTKVRGSSELGFYSGSKDEKLMQNNIGAMLASKLGGYDQVYDMISDGRLILLPMSDIRGFDTTGIPTAVYLAESQNTTIDMMKLCLQRIGEDAMCIIDGDYNAQVDSSLYFGSNNGMHRASEIFRGHDVYGEIELQNIYRSEIAQIAEDM